MTSLSLESILQIEKGTEGVTPGPWDARVDLVRAIVGDLAIPIFEVRDPWKKHRHTKTVVRQAWHNQQYVAMLSPEVVSELCRLAKIGLAGGKEWRAIDSIGDPEGAQDAA